jgi:hypothetical protein
VSDVSEGKTTDEQISSVPWDTSFPPHHPEKPRHILPPNPGRAVRSKLQTQSSKTVSGTITSQSDAKQANITGSFDGNNFIFSMAAGGTGASMTLVSQVNGNSMTAKSASGFGCPNGTQVQISSWSGTLTKQ